MFFRSSVGFPLHLLEAGATARTDHVAVVYIRTAGGTARPTGSSRAASTPPPRCPTAQVSTRCRQTRSRTARPLPATAKRSARLSLFVPICAGQQPTPAAARSARKTPGNRRLTNAVPPAATLSARAQARCPPRCAGHRPAAAFEGRRRRNRAPAPSPQRSGIPSSSGMVYAPPVKFCEISRTCSRTTVRR